MTNENELLELFKVEELEKRYEMGWGGKTEVKIECGPTGCTGSVTRTFNQ